MNYKMHILVCGGTGCRASASAQIITRLEECPSVLVECGYLSNEEDCDFLMSEAGRLQIAAAIADGIAQQLNIA